MCKQTEIFRVLVGISFLLVIATSGFGQKLKSDGYKITLKSVEKKEMRFHSKIYLSYKGSLKVSSKDSLKGTYQFSFLDLGEGVGNLSFKNSDNKTIAPKLIFDKNSDTFTYKDKTGKEEKMQIKAGLAFEEFVLQGILIWIKATNKAP